MVVLVKNGNIVPLRVLKQPETIYFFCMCMDMVISHGISKNWTLFGLIR